MVREVDTLEAPECQVLYTSWGTLSPASPPLICCCPGRWLHLLTWALAAGRHGGSGCGPRAPASGCPAAGLGAAQPSAGPLVLVPSPVSPWTGPVVSCSDWLMWTCHLIPPLDLFSQCQGTLSTHLIEVGTEVRGVSYLPGRFEPRLPPWATVLRPHSHPRVGPWGRGCLQGWKLGRRGTPWFGLTL